MPRRLIAAEFLLILGVALATDQAWYWAVCGYLLLLFVPALIFDAAVRAARSKCSNCEGVRR